MKLSNNYFDCTDNSFHIQDDVYSGFDGLESIEFNEDILDETDVEDINKIYPELSCAYSKAEYDYLMDNETGKIVSIVILASPELTSTLNAKKIGYKIKNDYGTDIVSIDRNTIVVPLDYSDDVDNGELVFITRLK